ncbi:MAG: pyridoxamine 5'-phosphate oxidase [Chloroflexota bacterium]|nr:pyridoxamine 5'-phosphate oxidase [Chloroflexia bacterium]MDQ3467735.1 pyridoxamine 5'-phosphate oxidase [Chloroflexota bacterium]
MSIADLRLEYKRASLDLPDLDPNPIDQFAVWFAEAQAAEVPEGNAMTLATATADGVPSARIVLLKAFDARGFVFYTNYESAKGRDLDENPRAALTFFWPALERQVRIAGTVSQVSREESQRYFDSRPLGSRIAASASKQSEVLADRAVLEAEFAALQNAFQNGNVPLPRAWGGYRVSPFEIEFWQGRPSRLHDRLRYVRQTDERWRIERLSP